MGGDAPLEFAPTYTDKHTTNKHTNDCIEVAVSMTTYHKMFRQQGLRQ